MQKFAETVEQRKIREDYGEYLKEEHKGKLNVERKVMKHSEQLSKQIQEKRYMSQQSP